MEPRDTISKSSYENFDKCELGFFIQYKLKQRKQLPNAKRDLGTALHSVMENLALIKKNIQDGGPNYIENDLGKIEYDAATWLSPRELSEIEVATINKNRTNKDFFRDRKRCILKGKVVREGEELVEKLIDLAFDKYLRETIEWVYANTKKKDPFEKWYREACWLSIEQFDPRKVNVIDVEKQFDLILPWDWAKLDNGKYIRVFGYIDLIYEQDGHWIILDFKSGVREKDFKAKTYSDIKKDLQLSIYSYAINQLYPHITNVCDLFFVRDGGIFTVSFDPKENEKSIEGTLREHIEKVKTCEDPSMLSPNMMSVSQKELDDMGWFDLKKNQIDSFCRYLCPAYQNKSYGKKCDCVFIKEKIQEHGMEYVLENYKAENNGNN